MDEVIYPGKLIREIAQGYDISIQIYDTTRTAPPGEPLWMYASGAYGTFIYRVEGGSYREAEVDLSEVELFKIADIDKARAKVIAAFKEIASKEDFHPR